VKWFQVGLERGRKSAAKPSRCNIITSARDMVQHVESHPSNRDFVCFCLCFRLPKLPFLHIRRMCC
jgi:hypothetical protein